ncbi:MAG: AbgT family transporter, partial [Bacteroidetes bacterium]|nr:AbgT family transporter [Bacteroidota bacterium]
MADKKKRGLAKILHWVEVGGNALPHPATLFLILALLALLFSWIGHIAGWAVTHPVTGETIATVNLLSKGGFHRIMLEMVNNYTGFAPLGIVMVAILGIGIAESSGLISAAIRLLVLKSPRRILTFVIVFTGIISNVASDLGYVLIIPLAGVIFHSVGRHPIAGMAAAFAGVSGGFSANVLIGTIDPLLAGLSTEAAHIIDPGYLVLPTANYYFMAVSTFVIALTGTWVTSRFVEPRLGVYTGHVEPEPLDRLNPGEKKGIVWVMAAVLLIFLTMLLLLLPADGFLRGPDNSILTSPVLKGFIAFLFVFAAILGIIYGAITGKFK